MTASSSPVPGKLALLNGFRVVAGVMSLLVLVQAILAGQYLYPDDGDGSITLHGVLGNVSFLLAVAGLVLAVVARAPKTIIGVAAGIVALMVVQIILGYSDGAGASAWHIPNGTVVFGLSVYQVSLVRRMARHSVA